MGEDLEIRCGRGTKLCMLTLRHVAKAAQNFLLTKNLRVIETI